MKKINLNYISNYSLSVSSISKHSGALISSKLIPEKIGEILRTISINFLGSFS